ncbi:MAG: hypothetical protein AMXMBFR84_30870 [Candidatus Hydrogenedentota bacterium]
MLFQVASFAGASRSEYHVIPASALNAFRDILIKYTEPSTLSDGTRGLRIKSTPDELSTLGFRASDLVRRINRDYVTSHAELRIAISKAAGTAVMDIVVIRNGTPRQIAIGLEGGASSDMQPVTPQAPAKPSAPPAPSVNTPPPPPDKFEFVVDEAEFEREWEKLDYLVLLTELQPTMYTTPDGGVTGMTSANLGSFSLARKLGLRNNDVIYNINGEALNSPEKIFELAEKLEGQSKYTVRILRDGLPITHLYSVKKN